MEVPRHWRLKKQRYSLTGDVCQECNNYHFPPRAICPDCGSGAKANGQYQDQQSVLAVTERAEIAS